MSATATNQAGLSASATEAAILERRDGAVAVLTLNEPARRNVLSRSTLRLLAERIRSLGADRTVKCVVLKANGPAFSAGHDLREALSDSAAELEALFADCTVAMEAIRLAPIPVIAQVHALATAAGCQLAATCDLVVAADTASFATPGVKIGLFCSTPAVALSRAVSAKKALEMLFTGVAIPAAEAERIGLVNRVVPLDRLDAETLELAQRIASASRDTLARGKRAFYEQLPLDRPAAYHLAERAMVDNAQTPDAKEGMRAFLEKRPPQWRD